MIESFLTARKQANNLVLVKLQVQQIFDQIHVPLTLNNKSVAQMHTCNEGGNRNEEQIALMSKAFSKGHPKHEKCTSLSGTHTDPNLMTKILQTIPTYFRSIDG